jgi:hypothetical protein
MLYFIFKETSMRKRQFIVLALVLLVASALVPLLGAQGDNVDVYGRPLPEDAAPYDQQVMNVLCNPMNVENTFSAMVAVYRRICGMGDQFGDPLVDLDNNLRLIPARSRKLGTFAKTASPGRSNCAKARSGAMARP